MNTYNLPFQIGEQYENWEFELEILPDRIKGYDSYKYIGKEFNIFLNYSPDETELIFNLDILECVLFIFKDRNEHFYNILKNLKLKDCNFDVVFKNNEIYIIKAKPELLNELKLSFY